jgi:hypothetical protein
MGAISASPLGDDKVLAAHFARSPFTLQIELTSFEHWKGAWSGKSVQFGPRSDPFSVKRAF